MTNEAITGHFTASIAHASAIPASASTTPNTSIATKPPSARFIAEACLAAATSARRAVRAHGPAAACLLVGIILGACATSTRPLPPAAHVAPPIAPPVEPSVEPPASDPIRLAVTATAYNSVPAQTDSDPTITAHGVRLEPGMRVIAVSRDLEAMGLGHGTRVRIEGLPGEWTVVDRMARRWRRRIDVYMGLDVEQALQFGRRDIEMQWLASTVQ